MRKDEIEERIIQLEQDIRTLKADHRDGVETILLEMQKIQNSVIEERISVLRERIIDGYEKIFMDLMLKNAEHNLEAQCLDPCTRNRRNECKEFLLARLKVTVQKEQYPDIILPCGRETINDKTLINKAPFLSEEPCNTCFSAYLNEKEQIKMTLGLIKESRESLVKPRINHFVSDLPGEIVISKLVEPLSHKHRFAMLQALSTGSMSFKELGSLTGSHGGHLLYHVTKLIEAGFVVKTESGKNYSITDKGLGIMDLVKQLYSQNGNLPVRE
nr:helix-turn-helix domain-containing protein [uncultured Methanospirillum sp.]